MGTNSGRTMSCRDADYDRVYYDSVTGASLPSKLCEEAMQLEIKYMKEMTVGGRPREAAEDKAP